MAADHVRFTVKVLPATRKGDQQQEDEEPVQTLAIGAKSSESFEDLRQKVQARYNARYSRGNRREVNIGELQDSYGADIFEADTIESLYGDSSFGEQHTIYARLITPDQGPRIATFLESGIQGAKRQASDGVADDDNASAKRRKVLSEDKGRSAASQRVDADGFKIPRRKKEGSAQAGAADPGAGATVLVEDSQPEGDAVVASSALARLQQRTALNKSSPAARSSPLVALTTKGVSNGQANSKTGISRKALPTPESRERQRLDAHESKPGQPNSNGQKVSSWFKRQTPTTVRSAAAPSFTQEDPIEDPEQIVGEVQSTARVPSSSDRAGAEHGDDAELEQNHKPPRKDDVNQTVHSKSDIIGKLRTPSVQRCKSTQTDTSHPASRSSASGSAKNTARSVAHGWTKEEDALLMTGLSARKGKRVEDVLKENSIDRSASAARSRYRLLVQNMKDRQKNTLNFPSSSLAMPQSDSENESAAKPTKAAPKRWSQSDIGTLRKAISEGLDAREIQAKYFGGRSEEAIMGKMREVQPSVFKVERRRDSFPKDAVRSHLWTDKHSLKLRRAYREGLNVVAAASRYFMSMPTALVEQKMVAYRQQMEDLHVERTVSQQVLPESALVDSASKEVDHEKAAEIDRDFEEHTQPDVSAKTAIEVSREQDDVDAEILRDLEELDGADDDDADEDHGPMIQDSYETGSAVAIASSPPMLRKSQLRRSPEVVIPPTEQVYAQHAQLVGSTDQQSNQAQLRRRHSSGGQMQLNFQRDKGKGAVRPAVDYLELHRQYSKHPQRAVASSKKQNGEHEVINISSGEDDDGFENFTADHAGEESSQPLPQLDGSSSTVKNRRQQQAQQHPASDGAESDGNTSFSGGEPSRQLVSELEQSMSAAEQSTQSQTELPAVNRPIAYVHIPSPHRGQAVSRAQYAQWEDSDDEDVAFQTQDPSTTLSQQQKRNRASSRAGSESLKVQEQHPDQEVSDGGSVAFQTQDPATTLSQKQKVKAQRKAESARKATSMLRDAVNRFEASQQSQPTDSSAPEHSSTNAIVKPVRVAKSRRSVYDIPDSSQSRAGSQGQRSSRSSVPQSSSEKRRPGQLPRILGPASKLAQRKRDAEAKAAARKAKREEDARSSENFLYDIPDSRHNDEDIEEIVRDGTSANARSHVEQQVIETSDGRDGFGKLGDSYPSTEQPLEPTTVSHALVDAHPSLATTSQSQVQVQHTIELPYPQILSREPGPNGKLEVGRPGLSFKVPQDCIYLRTDEEILATASQDAKGKRDIKRLAEDLKLSDQQAIAMCCNDSDKLKELRKLDRRRRRERRVEDGLPPSRGPARSQWTPGLPKPVEWDVNVMPDSDDSMSSRDRVDADFDDEMDEMEEERDAEMDNDDNPAYFDRSRHFSEVEEESEDEEVDLRELESSSSKGKLDHGDEDETPLNHSVDIEAKESDGGANESSPSSDAIEEPGIPNGIEMSREAASTADHSVSVGADAIQDTVAEAPSVERIADTDLDHTAATQDSSEAQVGMDLTWSPAQEEEQEDDAELPTAPPPASDVLDETSAPPPSTSQLQDLVQSGDVEMDGHVQDAAAFTETRLLPRLGSSPIGYPTLPSREGAFNDTSLATTTFFSPINTRRRDETTPQYYRRRNASPNRNPELTDSMLPPWPSSGRVRASLEAESTQTPPVATSQEPSMASVQEQVPAKAASKGTKRKREPTAEEIAEARASRKERKKERREERRSLKQQEVKPLDLPSERVSDSHPKTGKPADEPTAPKAGASEPPSASAKSSSKRKSRKHKKHNRESDAAITTTSDQQPTPKPVTKDDSLAMPLPALPPQHVQTMQQSSLPSPDSEFNTTLSKNAKKSKKRHARREARRASTSISLNDSVTSDTSAVLPMASSPPVLTVGKATISPSEIPILPPPTQLSQKPVNEAVETLAAEPSKPKSKKQSHKKPEVPSETPAGESEKKAKKSHKKASKSADGSNDSAKAPVSKIEPHQAEEPVETPTAEPPKHKSMKAHKKASKSAKESNDPSTAQVSKDPTDQSEGLVEKPAAESLKQKTKKSHKKTSKIADGFNDTPVQQMVETTPDKKASKKRSKPAEHVPSMPNEPDPKKVSEKKASESVKKATPPKSQEPSASVASSKKKITKSIEPTSPSRDSKAASQKTASPNATSIKDPESSSESDVPLQKKFAKVGKPATAGASSGLKDLMGFQPHIPAAPKVRPEVEKGAVKTGLFGDDDDDDSDSEESEESDDEL